MPVVHTIDNSVTVNRNTDDEQLPNLIKHLEKTIVESLQVSGSRHLHMQVAQLAETVCTKVNSNIKELNIQLDTKNKEKVKLKQLACSTKETQRQHATQSNVLWPKITRLEEKLETLCKNVDKLCDSYASRDKEL